MINIVIQSGNVGSDPRVHNGKTTILSFPIATTSGFGQNKKISWVQVKVFAKLAEIMQDKIAKGTRVVVQGQLTVEEYEKDGVKQSKTVILASDIELGSSGQSPRQPQQNNGYQQPQQPQNFQAPAPQPQAQPQPQGFQTPAQKFEQQQGGLPPQHQSSIPNGGDYKFDDDIPFAPIGLQYNNSAIYVI